MEKSDFDRLLQRYLDGKLSERERVKLEAWLEVMKTETTADLELNREDEDRLFQKITSNLDNIAEIRAFRPDSGKKTRIIRWSLSIAAGLLLAVFVSYLLWYTANRNPGRLKVVAENGVEKIMLNDGSLVWLRDESTLVYYEKADGTRYGELSGAALFEVAKDPLRPFMLHCGDVTVKVLGTSFTLKGDGDHIELNVLTGKVNLSSQADRKGIDVEPNEKIFYKSGKIEKLPLDQREISAITANTTYNMQFTNASMNEIVKRIGDKFNVKIYLPVSQAGKCRITADFTDHSLESSLQMITEVLEVEYTRKDDTIIITGKGCQ